LQRLGAAQINKPRTHGNAGQNAKKNPVFKV